MGRNTKLDLTLEGLAHDLNNVFETISEAADLLEGDPKWGSLAATLRRSVNRGRRIIGACNDAGLASQEFDQILGNAIEFARDFFRAVHAPPIKFITEVQPGIILPGCSAEWERVLINLFVNAAQAMEKGGTVQVDARTRRDEVEIMVADDGPCIPAEILPRIFEAHFSTKSSNAGLGLHIAQSIVTRHGGSISAENRATPGGAVFRIRVPGIQAN